MFITRHSPPFRYAVEVAVVGTAIALVIGALAGRASVGLARVDVTWAPGTPRSARDYLERKHGLSLIREDDDGSDYWLRDVSPSNVASIVGLHEITNVQGIDRKTLAPSTVVKISALSWLEYRFPSLGQQGIHTGDVVRPIALLPIFMFIFSCALWTRQAGRTPP